MCDLRRERQRGAAKKKDAAIARRVLLNQAKSKTPCVRQRKDVRFEIVVIQITGIGVFGTKAVHAVEKELTAGAPAKSAVRR